MLLTYNNSANEQTDNDANGDIKALLKLNKIRFNIFYTVNEKGRKRLQMAILDLKSGVVMWLHFRDKIVVFEVV